VDKRIEPGKPKRAPSRLKKVKISALIRLCGYILLAAAVVLVVKYRNSIAQSRAWQAIFGETQTTQAEPADTIETGAGAESVVAAIDEGICVLSPDGLRVYNLSGSQQLYIPGEIENPVLETDGDFALCYDLGGTFYALADRFSQAVCDEAAEAITDGFVTDSGAFCLVSRESGYRSVVTVYDAEGRQTYKWYSALRYIVCATLSPDGRNLACAGLYARDGENVSTLMFFDTGSDQALESLDFEGRCALDLLWLASDGPCAVFSDGAEFFTPNGVNTGSYSYAGGFLRGYAAGEDFVAVALGAYSTGGNCTLYSVDAAGGVDASVDLGTGALYLDARGGYVAVTGQDGVAVYTKSLETVNLYTDADQIRMALARKDGTAFLIGDKTVTIRNSR